MRNFFKRKLMPFSLTGKLLFTCCSFGSCLFIFLACKPNPSPESNTPSASIAPLKVEKSYAPHLYGFLQTDSLYHPLVDAIDSSGLAGTLQEKGPYTLFAFSQRGIDNLPEHAWTNLMKPELRYSLSNLLKNHIVMGSYALHDLADGQELTSLAGKTLRLVKTKEGLITVNGIRILAGDFKTGNGYVHVMERLLLPKK